MTTITPVNVPYSGAIPGGVRDGLEIEIQGSVSSYAREGFSVNLCQGPRKEPNTALHFNPRFHQGCVVLNHMHNGSWGSEQRGSLTLQKGQSFSLQVVVKPQEFKIKVNGKHFTDFGHRLPKETSQFILIDGEVTVSFIRFSGRKDHHFRGGGGFAQPMMDFPQPPPYSPYPAGGAVGAMAYPGGSQPIYNPGVPFTAGIPGGMHAGSMIYVSGVPHSRASRFTVNLQDYSGSNIALHFDVRFNFGDSHNVVVRNHSQRGQWGQEERQASYFPFMPNSPFEILILAEPSSFKVAINNQHFVEFRHRLPIHSAANVSVSGDVSLSQVRFQ